MIVYVVGFFSQLIHFKSQEQPFKVNNPNLIFCLQVIAEKQLVKHLQKEVARLEAELRSPEPSGSLSLSSLLVEKELKIQQVELGGVFHLRSLSSVKCVWVFFS
jgi:hypothetical protein